MLVGILVTTYIMLGLLAYKVWKHKPRETIVYVPMLDKELAIENKILQSKLFSAEIRIEKLKSSYEAEMQKSQGLQTILDDIYKGQNRYKEIK